MKKLTKDSRLKDLLHNPLGNDLLRILLAKFNMDVDDPAINNFILKNFKIKHLKMIFSKWIDDEMIDMIIDKSSHYDEILLSESKHITKKWWKEAVFYQIYPRSFYDSNGDGIGDIAGIIEKLDYLKELGIDALWINPIYDSPMDDNGYDIRDYKKINPEFGTMKDFDKLLKEVHKRDMKLIMDLVINHTSDEHEWFQKSRHKDSKYRDYYIWKDIKDINNWKSIFGGSAWEYDEISGEYYLHLFSKKQPDLNWESEDMKSDLYKMINWWIKKGIDGFRLDVITFISKPAGYPNGCVSFGDVSGYTGVEHYMYGPDVHNYLRELRKETFSKEEIMTVGEAIGIAMESERYFIEEKREELDLIFNFEHLNTPSKNKWNDYRYDLNYLKKYLINSQAKFTKGIWRTIFFENHDNQRMINKITYDMTYREEISKLLSTIMLTIRATPFIFQGQEIGMVNPEFTDIEEFRDLESINLYFKEMNFGEAEKSVIDKLNHGSRDNSRVPISWSKGDNAGFTSGRPWIMISNDYEAINVEDAMGDQNSVYHFYRRLISIRKHNQTLIYGDFKPLLKYHKDVFGYLRTDEKNEFMILLNLSGDDKKIGIDTRHYELLISNYNINDGNNFKPFEIRVYEKLKNNT